MKHFAKYDCLIGTLLIESDDEFITKIDLIKDIKLLEKIDFEQNSLVFSDIKLWLDAYFANKQILVDPKIKFIGTKFQKLVWEGLQKLAKFGQTITYKDLANYVISKNKQSKMSC